MAYEMVMPYHLHMPSYFLETFTEYSTPTVYNISVRNCCNCLPEYILYLFFILFPILTGTYIEVLFKYLSEIFAVAKSCHFCYFCN